MYFTYNVASSVVVAASKPITIAVTPEVAPVIVTGVVELKYCDGSTVSEAKVDVNFKFIQTPVDDDKLS